MRKIKLPPFSLSLDLIFSIALLFFTWRGKLPLIIAGIYAAMSLITFILYAIDKSAAKHRRWRTQEKTLHLFALFGGWPGALLAQRILRHKSSKTSFKLLLWLTVLLNLVALSLFYIEKGIRF